MGWLSNGFDSSHPEIWGELDPSRHYIFRYVNFLFPARFARQPPHLGTTRSLDTIRMARLVFYILFLACFHRPLGGAFDFCGSGVGYDKYYLLTNEQFANVGEVIVQCLSEMIACT